MTVRKLTPYLPYAGIPFIGIALAIIWLGGADAFSLLNYSLIIIFGYIAAILDLKSKKIPNKLTVAMFAAWLMIMTPKLFLDTNNAVATLLDSALGFALAGGLFILVYLISRKGLGGGDVKFMAAAGVFLGFGKIIPATLYGSILAALTALTLILLKKIKSKDTIPLIPFLYVGILLTIFFN